MKDRRAYLNAWRIAHIDEVRATSRASSARYHKANVQKRRIAGIVWRAANKDKLRAQQAARHAANPSKKRIAATAWQQANPDRVCAITAARRAAKLQRTPPWANLKEIEKIYTEAQSRTATTGTPWHVDHIIPLRGKHVSGLHIHTNLQVLLGVENKRKQNRYVV